jgi:uncharacterized membrane protein YfcA
MLGTPGYAMIVPGLLMLSIIPDYTKAVGTYLLTAAVPLTIAGAYVYYTRKQIDFEISFILMGTLFFGAILGAYLSKFVSESIREFCAGLIESVIGPFFILKSFSVV